MGKADLHIHTTYSYDSSSTVSVVLEWAKNFADLDVIAITDHDAIGGAQEAEQMAPKYGIEVIPGCEITTQDGHLLALFIRKSVPPGLPLIETLLRIGEQGGVAVAAHPMAFLAHGLRKEVIQEALLHPDARQVLLGIETWNTGIFYQGTNHAAQRINAEVGLASVGNSDSHLFWTIGTGYTQFPGYRAQDLRQALLERKTTAHHAEGHRAPDYWPRHIASHFLRKLGWVTWTPEPNASFMLRRLAEIQVK